LAYYLKNDLPENIGIIGGINTPIKEIKNCTYLLKFIVLYIKRLIELENNQNGANLSLIKKDEKYIVKEAVEDFIDLNKDNKYIRGCLISLGEYLSWNNSNYFNLALDNEMF